MNKSLSLPLAALLAMAWLAVPVLAEDDADAPLEPNVKTPAKRAEVYRGEQTEETSPAMEAKKAITNPVPWFHWGMDQRLRSIWDHNAVTLSKAAPGNDRYWQRFRTRVWGQISPTEDIDLNLRVVWEWINFCRPDSLAYRPIDFSDVLFDRLNVEWRNVLGQPLTLKVGRQDLVYGDRWLIFEGTPLDGSRTIYFDAIKASYNAEPLKTIFDFVVFLNGAESDYTIPPLHNNNAFRIEHNEFGAFLYAKHRGLKNTDIDGYFIFNHRTREKNAPAPNFGDDAKIYVVGGRVEHRFNEHWVARAEAAQQLGRKNANALCAFGFNSRLTYFWKDKCNNQTRVAFEYQSGDDPGTGTDEQFDNMWGRWPQWSELLQGWTGRLEFRPGEYSNFYRAGFGHSIFPSEKLELCMDYHLLFADENTYKGSAGFSNEGKFRGQLLAALARYTLLDPKTNPVGLYGHGIAEFFFPGNYFDSTRNDPAVFLRYELSIQF